MLISDEFCEGPVAKKFATDLLILLAKPENEIISPEVWANNDLVDRKALRNSFAASYQILDLYRALGSRHDASEAALIERVSADKPVKRLMLDHLVEMRDSHGISLERWRPLDHYFHDVLNEMEGNWAFRNIRTDD